MWNLDLKQEDVDTKEDKLFKELGALVFESLKLSGIALLHNKFKQELIYFKINNCIGE